MKGIELGDMVITHKTTIRCLLTSHCRFSIGESSCIMKFRLCRHLIIPLLSDKRWSSSSCQETIPSFFRLLRRCSIRIMVLRVWWCVVAAFLLHPRRLLTKYASYFAGQGKKTILNPTYAVRGKISCSLCISFECQVNTHAITSFFTAGAASATLTHVRRFWEELRHCLRCRGFAISELWRLT